MDLLEAKLQSINSKLVKIEDKKNNNDIIQQILKTLLDYLKKDVLFEILFERLLYTGSYYSNLKISKPDEYDICFVLNLPKLSNTRLLTYNETTGYADVELDFTTLRRHYYYHEMLPKLEKLCDLKSDNFYILNSIKLHRWFESLIQKFLNNVNNEIGNYKIMMSKGGPAITFHVEPIYSDCNKFDVDLVPCLKFANYLLPHGYREYDSDPRKNTECFYAVPKPIANAEWRLTFIFQERQIIENHGHVKAAIRLLKLLRDEYNDTLIKSYYILTVAMWDVQDNNYKRKSLSFTFMSLLKAYCKAISDKDIPFFWNPSYNMLKNRCSAIYFDNLEGRLKRIIKKIETYYDPSSIDDIFKHHATVDAYKDDHHDNDTLIYRPGISNAGWWGACGAIAVGAGLLAIMLSGQNRGNNN